MAQQLQFEKHLLGGNAHSLKLAFVIAPIDSLKAWRDSTVAMMRAAANHGHEVYAIEAHTLGWRRPEPGHPGGVFGEWVHLHLRPDDHDWYRETGREWLPLRALDAVVVRLAPPCDSSFLAATWLLDRAEAEGLKVFNRPRALREFSEKMAIAEFPQFAPETLISADLNRIRQFIDEARDVILKPVDGGIRGEVFRVHRNDPNRNVIVETLARQGGPLVAQRYLPEIAQGDKHLLLIGGRPVPFCLARIPQAGEVRGSLAAGGTGIAQELGPHDRQIAEALGPVLLKRGVLFAGLDIIGNHLVGIHVTDPGCMIEIRQQSGFDAAGASITAIEHACGIS